MKKHETSDAYRDKTKNSKNTRKKRSNLGKKRTGSREELPVSRN